MRRRSTSRNRATSRSAVAGSPGPLEKKTPSGPCSPTPSTSSMVAVAGSTCTSMPRSRHELGSHRLDAEVEGSDGEAGVAHGRDGIRLARRDLGCERGSCHLGARAHRLEERLDRSAGGVAAEEAHPHRPPLAKVSCQRPGVDLAHADDALVGELVLELAGGAPVGRPEGGVAHDVARRPDARALVVLAVDAGVADVRGRHDDDLPVVARVGEGLLVAGHAGREDRLSDGLAERAVGRASEGAAVLEHEHRGLPPAARPPVTARHGQWCLGGHRSAPGVAVVSGRWVREVAPRSWVMRPA